MCQLHLFYSSEPPLCLLRTGGGCSNATPDTEPTNEAGFDSGNDSGRTLPPSATCKPRQLVQLDVARIRTRTLKNPRTNPQLVPQDVFNCMRSTFVAMESLEDMKFLNKYVECRHHVLERGPYISILPFRKEALSINPAELKGGAPQLKLCLLPHLEYSFDLCTSVSPGKDFIMEHSRVFWCVDICFLVHRFTQCSAQRTTIAFVPDLPLKASIPINIVDMHIADYFDQPTPKFGRNAHSASSSPRPGPIARYSDMTNLFGFEKSTDEIMLAAPPVMAQTNILPRRLSMKLSICLH